MLLVVAGLFVRSAKNAEHMYLGFDPSHVLNATVDLRTMGFDKPKARRFYQDLVERADASRRAIRDHRSQCAYGLFQ